MIPVACTDYRTSLGAYVLGALDPVERVALESHLAECPDCRSELADLAVLPGLLARLDTADAEETLVDGSAPTAPPELLDRLLDAASRDRRVARRRRVLVAAAAVIVASGGAAAVGAQLNQSSHHSHGVVLTAVGPPPQRVAATITATPRAWGTAVHVQLTHAPEDETCSLVAVSDSGVRDVAASWHVGYHGSVAVDGATSLQSSDIASYQVVTSDGQMLVSTPA